MDKVGAKMLDLFRTYWAAMERLEVSASWVGFAFKAEFPAASPSLTHCTTISNMLAHPSHAFAAR